MPVEEVQNSGFTALVARKIKAGVNVRTAVICAVAVVLFTLVFGNCTLAIFIHRDYPQFAFAETIKEDSDGNDTLLCYRMSDRGYYAALDQAPRFKYFALNDFTRETLPELYEETERYVLEGEADYIVVEYDTYMEDKDIFDEGGYAVMEEYSYIRIKANYHWGHDRILLLKKPVSADLTESFAK